MSTTPTQTIQLLDEHVLAYLKEHPEFFDRQPALLLNMKVSSAHGGRAISLQERQMEVMREKHKALESKLAELIHIARDNDAIVDKMHAWNRLLLLAEDASQLPELLMDGLQETFSMPQAALRLWSVRTQYTHLPCAQAVPVETITLANSMMAPYCGMNSDFQAATWLANQGADARSLALLPLRKGADPKSFGLLVLGSPDANRFKPNMQTSYLARMAETASAALSRLTESH